MKSVALVVLAVLAIGFVQADNPKCSTPMAKMTDAWRDMNQQCIGAVKKQVQEELKASMKYLAMGAYFSRDRVNRPGFSDFFFKAATEEREHATKLIEYLLMRGELSSVSNLIKVSALQSVEPQTFTSGVDALKQALELEAAVTKMIKNVIIKCESAKKKVNGENIEDNDYHIVDYLTGEFLEEQYHGQRQLAGMISTLDKMMASHGAIGEFLYDKTLLQ